MDIVKLLQMLLYRPTDINEVATKIQQKGVSFEAIRDLAGKGWDTAPLIVSLIEPGRTLYSGVSECFDEQLLIVPAERQAVAMAYQDSQLRTLLQRPSTQELREDQCLIEARQLFLSAAFDKLIELFERNKAGFFRSEWQKLTSLAYKTVSSGPADSANEIFIEAFESMKNYFAYILPDNFGGYFQTIIANLLTARLKKAGRQPSTVPIDGDEDGDEDGKYSTILHIADRRYEPHTVLVAEQDRAERLRRVRRVGRNILDSNLNLHQKARQLYLLFNKLDEPHTPYKQIADLFGRGIDTINKDAALLKKFIYEERNDEERNDD